MEESSEDIIKAIVVDLVRRMDFSAEVEVIEEKCDQETFLCMVHMESGQNTLIGQHGVNLAALQHLVRVIMRKKIQEQINVIVDVNEYFLNKRAILEQEAEKAAREVLNDHISVALRPMLPYERKIVHNYLAKNNDVTTESVGYGEGRKIMVRSKPIVGND
jgi:spoIIIJ-associated protein